MIEQPLLSGEAARILGVSADRVRELEVAGRLVAVRTPSGTRLYERAQVEELAAARAAVRGPGGAAAE